MKPKTKGIRRLINATGYSTRGLRSLWNNEAAFRQETALSVVLLPVIMLADISAAERALLIVSLVLILIVEMLNSAIETVVDRIGEEQNELSGRAKDIGSAAVLMSLVGAAAVWVIIFWPR